MNNYDYDHDRRTEAMLDEAEENYIQHKVRSDFDFATEQAGFNSNMTVSEFAQAVSQLQAWGWDVSACEMLDLL